MKKIITSIFLFILCLSFYMPTQVSAAVTDENSIANPVYRMGISINSNSDIYSYNAVSQYYYKNPTDLSEKDKDINDHYTKGAKYNQLNDQEMCSLYSNLCKKTTNGESYYVDVISEVTIGDDGDVVIKVRDGATINSLTFYYIVADQSGSAFLYCDWSTASLTLCDNARKITNTNSNWKRDSKSGSFIFSSNNLESNFTTKKEDTDTDQVMITTYYNYNLFEKMDANYSKAGLYSGVYVIAKMSVDYNNETYYANLNIVNETEFDKTMENKNANYYNETLVYLKTPTNSDKQYDEMYHRRNNSITSVEKNADGYYSLQRYAALIHSSTSLSATSNKGYNTLNSFFKKNLQPIIMVVVGAMFLIGAITTGMSIVKSGDEPEVRSAEIKKLVGLITGLIAIELILFFYEEIIEAIYGIF